MLPLLLAVGPGSVSAAQCPGDALTKTQEFPPRSATSPKPVLAGRDSVATEF